MITLFGISFNLPIPSVLLHALNFLLRYRKSFVQGIEYFLLWRVVLAEVVRP